MKQTITVRAPAPPGPNKNQLPNAWSARLQAAFPISLYQTLNPR
jgi:hypothetical protein